jgi:signal transduction histidine kinase
MPDFEAHQATGRSDAPGSRQLDSSPACAEACQVKQHLDHYRRLAAKVRFVAGIGHALNNPLQVILGTADLLLADGPASPAWRARVEAVQDAADCAAATARSLMMFARERRLQPTGLRPAALFETVLERLRAPLHAGRITVRRHLDGEAAILADPPLMDEVLTHLVVNAEEAMRSRAGGVLTVGVARQADRVRVTVEDTGPGVPAGMRQRVFEPLYSSKMPQDGPGLGLAICHGIVAEHGGTLTVEDGTAGGARFVIDLPAAPADASIRTRSV